MGLPTFVKSSSLFLFEAAIGFALFVAASRFSATHTDGFSISKISSTLSYNPAWDTKALSQQEQNRVEQILSQSFSYLGCGGQCYAFLSEDGQYVLKFFKEHLRVMPQSLLSIPLPSVLEKIRQKKIAKGLRKLERDFSSCKIAIEELPKESGLLFVHLNKTQNISKKTTIIDKLHIAHCIDLNTKEFILQKKASLFFPHLESLIEKGDRQEVKNAIHSMVEVLVSRCQKGIFDEDPRLHRNLGFIENEAIFIDVGRFRRDDTRKDPKIFHQDLRLITDSLKLWLEENHPDFANLLEEELLQREENV